MTTQFALDLRAARRNAGLTQDDCAHLLGVDQSHMSELETGKLEPSVRDVCTLSLIFGKSFEDFFSTIVLDLYAVLLERLQTLPKPAANSVMLENRAHTLRNLSARLQSAKHMDHGA